VLVSACSSTLCESRVAECPPFVREPVMSHGWIVTRGGCLPAIVGRSLGETTMIRNAAKKGARVLVSVVEHYGVPRGSWVHVISIRRRL
jgi:hypothetical protein